MMKHLWPVLLVTLFACSNGPRDINYGKDNCKFCEMKIMDDRFGSESVTENGKIYTFDSGECLLNYLKKGREEGEFYGHLMVTVSGEIMTRSLAISILPNT